MTDRIEEPLAASETYSAALAPLWPYVLAQKNAMWSVKDAQRGRYRYVDPHFARWLGVDGADVIGKSDAELFDPAVAMALRAAEKTAESHGTVLTSEHRFERGGERHDFQVMRSVSERADGDRELVCIWFDQQAERRRDAQLRAALEQLEQQQRANDQLRDELSDQSLRDGDSGLYSRGHFEDQLRREVDLSTREHREFALVYLEIDPSSAKVRALGDAAQARIRATMGQLLRGNTRAMDASCRFSDRCFAVLLSGVGLATAHSRMEGLRRQCATQIVVLEGQEIGFTTSMGVASFPHTAHSQEELSAACESALAEAQRRGGNHVTLASIRFDPL